MTAARITRWAQRFLSVSALFLVVWQVGALLGLGREAQVVLGVYGFVFHAVFGKAYSLIPSYFDRELAVPSAPMIQFPFTVAGTACLALAAVGVGSGGLGSTGAVLWTLGVGVFLSSLGWTIRRNPTGRETGTGGVNEHRRGVDRVANGFVPAALAYLALGSYETLAIHLDLRSLFGPAFPRTVHLLAAGGATLLVFAIGFRLLPRFLVASPPKPLVPVVLGAGALGPLLLARYLRTGVWFEVGAVLEAVAMVGFATAYVSLFVASDRRRVGFYGVLLGVASGVAGVLIGLAFAFRAIDGSLAAAHYRSNLLGFLGLTIVGVMYQFYPPAVGSFYGASDRAAVFSILSIATGVVVEIGAHLSGVSALLVGGRALALVGSVVYAYLVIGLFYERSREE